MNKIAITGIFGAGKSTVGQILVNKGRPFVSADDLSRQAIKGHINTATPSFSSHGMAFKPLFKLLGPKYLNETGCFDTQKIAKGVFQDPMLLKKVEKILHPVVYDLLKEQEKKWSVSMTKGPFFYEIPLLFEKNLELFFSKKVVIAIDPKKQISRLKQNRDLSPKEIKQRGYFQLPQAEKVKKADYVIWNNGSLQDLKKQVTNFLSQITA